VVLYNASRISFGEDVYIAYGCWFSAGDQIVVGNDVLFGPYCVIVSAEHRRENASFRHGVLNTAPIKIGDGCWLAAHVTVTAGITIGNGCLVAAGAVVTSDVEPGFVVGGVPARKIKRLDDRPVVPDAS
jgi:acetyltransferase-like isoleucine patch superfamily enzyme